MTERDRAVARELKEKLAKMANLLDFKVYGSRARGDAADDSDMDVFVEVEKLERELKRKIWEAAWEVGFNNFMVISTLVFSKDELENTAMRASPLVANIAREGVRI